MNYDGLPQYVLAKLLALDEAVATLKAGADAVEPGIEDRRARRYGNVHRVDDNPRSLEAELERLVCTENSIRVDYVTESPNVSGDDRPVLPLLDPVRRAVQVKEPT